jgi:hypothetical protein
LAVSVPDRAAAQLVREGGEVLAATARLVGREVHLAVNAPVALLVVNGPAHARRLVPAGWLGAFPVSYTTACDASHTMRMDCTLSGSNGGAAR